jgi:hypothetical protein
MFHDKEYMIQSEEGGRQGREKKPIVLCNRKNDARIFFDMGSHYSDTFLRRQEREIIQ